jgi:hypothetical protein
LDEGLVLGALLPEPCPYDLCRERNKEGKKSSSAVSVCHLSCMRTGESLA